MGNNDLVYLAHPIDMGRCSPDLLNYAVGELSALGLTTYDPLGAFNVGGAPSNVINRVNQAAMDVATAAVAFLPEGVPTIGTPQEVGYLTAHAKPVLIISDNTVSWVVAGWRDGLFTDVYDLSEEGISAGVEWLKDQMQQRAAREADLGPVSPIIFEKTKSTATLPTKGYSDDAGYDLYASEDVSIPARGQAMVPCGVKVDIPEGMWAQITGRSSTLQKRNLMVAPTVGVIDEGYTGELFAPVVSISDEDVHVKAGERLAQLILHVAPGQDFTPAWGVVRTKERGSNGFGSTGA
ncbi:deoxyuridine triphosphatase [Streptomyces phage Keanu]|nr:deoxyuridine triphosphatase [Streptomyces phage Keanu]